MTNKEYKESNNYSPRKQEKEIYQIFAETLRELLATDERVVYLDADLMSAMKTKQLWTDFPDRVINVGIAEANMAGVAAGLFLTGQIPYIHSFAPFTTRRNFDQLFVSIAYAGKSLRIIGSEPGICASENGGTHMSFEDMALIRSIPEACIIDVSDRFMFRSFLKSTKERKGITYIRTPRRGLQDIYTEETVFSIGKGIVLREGKDITIVASGIMVVTALEAADILSRSGISAKVVDPVTIKPLDEKLIIRCAEETGAVVTAENHSIIGGLGSAVSELLSEKHPVPMGRIGVKDRFGQVGKEDYLRPTYALQATDIVSECTSVLKKKTGHPIVLKYDGNDDAISRDDMVKSNLIYGDPDDIPDPKISYVIPTYMRPELLKETLQSILEQDPVDIEWEIVVSDNEAGGENDTERLIRKINDKRIMYYRHDTSLKAIGNWNRAIKLARAPWVAMCHADDLVMHDHLKTALIYLKKYEFASSKPLAYISPMYIEFTRSSQVDLDYWKKRSCIYEGISLQEKRLIENDNKLIKYTQFMGAIKGESVFVPSNGTIMNKKIMIETGGFDPEYGVSTDLIKPFCLAGKYRVYKTARPLGFYRFDSNATMRPGVIHKMSIGLMNLAEYMYSKNIFTKVWGYFSRDERFEHVVNIMLRYAGYGGYNLTKEDFSDIHVCKKGWKRSVCKFVYRTVLKICEKKHEIISTSDLYFKYFDDHMAATLKKVKEAVKSDQPIIMYGAGEIGKLASEYVRKSGSQIEIQGFAVSRKEDVNSSFNDFPLFDIGTCVEKFPDALYVITTLPGLHNQIIETLKDYGINDYVCLV